MLKGAYHAVRCSVCGRECSLTSKLIEQRLCSAACQRRRNQQNQKARAKASGGRRR